MKIIKSINEMQRTAFEVREKNERIGFVATMGALHKGHLSLVDIVKKGADVIIISIFVNPKQFGTSEVSPQEDYERYPRDVEQDIKILEDKKVDIVFIPDTYEMYPEGHLSYVNVQELGEVLCGKSRPGHFKGVCTVLVKLFNIVKPDITIFGEKDMQQAIIVKKMVEDLNFDIEVITGPTIRENDGLAISSRNIYLSAQQRKDVPILYKSLVIAKEMIEKGERDSTVVIEKIRSLIEKKDAKIDYIDIVDKKDLTPAKSIKGDVLIALAVYFGSTRLIDNIVIGVNP